MVTQAYIRTASISNISKKGLEKLGKFKLLNISGGMKQAESSSFVNGLKATLSSLKVWKENSLKLKKEKNDELFIKNYYNEVLKHINIQDFCTEAGVYCLLVNDTENELERYALSAYLEIMYGMDININEVKIDDDGKIIPLQQKEEIKKIVYGCILAEYPNPKVRRFSKKNK